MNGLMDAMIYHYGTSHSGGSFGPEFPEPHWAIEEPSPPCPVCDRCTACLCFPTDWEKQEETYLEAWRSGQFDTDLAIAAVAHE